LIVRTQGTQENCTKTSGRVTLSEVCFDVEKGVVNQDLRIKHEYREGLNRWKSAATIAPNWKYEK
jgi:hypothetical protein